MITLIFYFVPILILGFIIALYAAGKDEKRIVQKTESLFQEIDEKYNNFIEKSLNLEILSQKEHSFDVNQVTEQCFTVIKADIDGIVSFINSVTYESIGLRHSSIYFKGATSMAQSFFRKTGSGPEKTLSKEDVQAFYESFTDAIKSDLTRRLLDLRANNYLD